MPLLAKFVRHMTARWQWLLLALLVSQLLSGFLMKQIEGWGFFEGTWWAHVTAHTVGYGDYSPKTGIGRLLAAFFQYFWLYCILGLGAHFVVALFPDPHQYSHKEQRWTFKLLRIIFCWVRWLVMAQLRIARRLGVELDPPPYCGHNGVPIECPPEPSDTEQGDVMDNGEIQGA